MVYVKIMSEIENNNNPTTVEVNSIMLLQNVGNYKDAFKACKNLFIKYPNSPLLHNMLGAINVGKSDFTNAIYSYLYAIKIKPNYAQAFNNLAILLKKLGEFNLAIISYLKAINLKPGYIEACNNLGLIYSETNEIQKSIYFFEMAFKINSNNEITNFNLGNIYYKQKKLCKAEFHFKKAIKVNSNYTEAYYNLGILYHIQEKIELAKRCYEKTIKLNPSFHEAKHMLNSLSGKTTKSAPRKYVEKLFDNYAANFEKSLVKNLKYNTPKIIKEMIIDNNMVNLGSVLDLGCGTGLIGFELKFFFKNIDGVDLSKFMLEEANNKKIYNNLFHSDIKCYLTTRNLEYDYIIAADVFVYIGDLSKVFKLIKERNKYNGKFVFSTEHTNRKGYFITKKGRYCHSFDYIKSLCKKFGYELLNFRKVALRKEDARNVVGGVYLLQF